ncbi:3-oxoacyl-[acyl-carrier-protein] synthase III C-terminal domain-containing protein [Rugamonas aquatica]|uniref:Ketoacyl-ACP synthase III n=1 Tax=Rugamonas aquatica TaxID=2743357 RepID=A0A6A7N6A4_9BURK|nr:3-oxoacyl-[acyl-carrier-protein] synthase III C-terminal domain-containing protein [Rugamonas aquatica]MQA40623.1 ketoacyl-ACP synthase III [Rugamonas aquatica]
MIPLRIRSSGVALPDNCVTSGELDSMLHHARGYCESRSGVAQRYFADGSLRQSRLGAQALQDALRRADLAPAGLDLVIGACAVPEQAIPATAVFIAQHAGVPAGVPAFDVNASCLSFLVALRLAAGMLADQQYRRIAVVAVDLASRGIDWDAPEASLIFGDGAAAIILERGAGGGIESFRYATYPEGARLCQIRGGGTAHNPRTAAVPADYLFQMDGKGVFRLASQHMGAFVADLLCDAGVTLADIDLVVPHQASHLGIEHMRRQLGIAPERMVDIYARHGNQVAASMPSALHHALDGQRASTGSRLLLIGTAAGLSLGGMVLAL